MIDSTNDIECYLTISIFDRIKLISILRSPHKEKRSLIPPLFWCFVHISGSQSGQLRFNSWIKAI
jgi:hypothetical protein